MKRFAVLALVMASAAGCGAAVKTTDPLPTDGLAPTRAALAAVEVLAETLRPVVPDSEEAQEAWTGLEAALSSGEALCDAWEDAGEAPSTWRDWVTRALGFIESMTTVLMTAGVAVPSYVGIAVGALKFLLPIVASLIGGAG